MNSYSPRKRADISRELLNYSLNHSSLSLAAPANRRFTSMPVERLSSSSTAVTVAG